jgi:hypothetical protein
MQPVFRSKGLGSIPDMDVNRIFGGFYVWYPILSGVVSSIISPQPPEYVCNAATLGIVRVICIIILNRAFFVSRDVGILVCLFFSVCKSLSTDPP